MYYKHFKNFINKLPVYPVISFSATHIISYINQKFTVLYVDQTGRRVHQNPQTPRKNLKFTNNPNLDTTNISSNFSRHLRLSRHTTRFPDYTLINILIWGWGFSSLLLHLVRISTLSYSSSSWRWAFLCAKLTWDLK